MLDGVLLAIENEMSLSAIFYRSAREATQFHAKTSNVTIEVEKLHDIAKANKNLHSSQSCAYEQHVFMEDYTE